MVASIATACQLHIKNLATWRHAQPKKQLIERLLDDIKKLKKADELDTIQDIFLGSITDAYQPLEEKYKQTLSVIGILEQNELPFTIITKNDLVLRDIDLLKGYKWCRVGTTITSLHETFRETLEPYTVTYEKRIEVLKQLKKANINTYLSGEPIFPMNECNSTEIVKLLRDYVDLFEFGKYSRHPQFDYVPYRYYKDNWTPQIYKDIFSNAVNYCLENGINYCISNHSNSFFVKYHLPFKPYPLLKPAVPSQKKESPSITEIGSLKPIARGQTSLTSFLN